MKPHGATHIENDGTYWMQTSTNEWYWWRDGWGWCQYVGAKNKGFYGKFRHI
ncbi:hypothetical protein [Acinetobacter sp. CFCC 10889]|uniref:hypothetical protein n=1 Tax=Acinetobacter sp. CFCC 10889 TaxID=1775557 RepID=UPI00148CBF42|nr:hypothetical protein [Acinetobacter sp. CFCC 10889]